MQLLVPILLGLFVSILAPKVIDSTRLSGGGGGGGGGDTQPIPCREVLNAIRVEGGEFGLCTSLLVLSSFQSIGLCWRLVVCLCFDHLNIWSDSQVY